MEIIPCCVDLTRFTGKRSCARKMLKNNSWQDNFVFMYPGKIGTFYLVDKMLDFFQFALKSIPDSLFVFLTQDDEKPLLDFSNAKGIDLQKIKIIKPKFTEIPGYLSLASCGLFFINPYKKIGSSPIKLAEFLACKVPVIINSGIGDTEELVRENRVGVVVKSFNEACFKEALVELLDLKKEEQLLRQRCRQTAKELLSLDLGVKKYWSLYQELGI